MIRESIDVDGQVVLTFIPHSQASPTADEAVALADLDVVVPAILDELAGWWFSSADDALIDALLDAGATLVRHGHLYWREIVSDDVALDPEVPDGMDLDPLTASAEELAVVSKAAYHENHPDFDPDHDTEGELTRLLAGDVVGPFNAGASWQLTQDGSLVAATVSSTSEGEPPFGGPWVSEVFRLPGPAYRGLGSVLIRQTIASLAASGERSLGLVVTDGNTAAHVYEHLGFVRRSSSRKLQIPAD